MRGAQASAVLCLLGAPAAAAAAPDPAWARAEKLVAQMTVAEKVQLLQGTKAAAGPDPEVPRPYIGRVPGIERLKIPDLNMNDGPEGFRCGGEVCPPGSTTQFPSGLTVAHSWDAALFGEWGTAMGEEFAGKGANVQFGPGANVARLANGGRSFEYLSGEDPYLGYVLIQPVIKGIQSQGVIANVKHFIDNNQEGALWLNGGNGSHGSMGAGDRHSTSEIVDEQTQMELYWPPFEGAVEAGVLSVMCANNMVNGVYVCENNFTENTLLKSWGGFKGWVCSDYDGTRSTIDAANGGLDIAMPGPPSRPDFFGTMLLDQLKAGTVKQSVVDEKATRIVYSLAKIGALDTPRPPTAGADVTSPAHRALARKLAAEACILLKNEGSLLPLAMDTTVAVIGDAGNHGAIYGGAGSGSVVPKNSSAIPLIAALKARGVSASHATGSDVSTATKLAKDADVAIVVLAQSSTEGHDRQWLNMSQAELVPIIAAANKKTIVLTISPGPFLTDWVSHAAALVDMGLPGEQESNGAIDVLFGVVNPSGKLPHTMPNKWNEVGMTPAQYPGTPPDTSAGAPPPCSFDPIAQDPGHVASPKFVPCSPTKAHYTEKLEVGYRWYEVNKVKPAFAFGFGLSCEAPTPALLPPRSARLTGLWGSLGAQTRPSPTRRSR